jgi:uncharacterized membrane protein
MKYLKHLLTRRIEAVSAKLIILVLAIAIIGFADAGYLTIEHYNNVVPPCSITRGCEQVLTSEFSTIFGIPVALLGMIYYFLIAAGLFFFIESRNHEMLRVTLLGTVLGLLASLWFVILQAFIIHWYCAYCMGSAATSTLLFIFAVFIFRKYKASVSMPRNSDIIA